MMPSPQIATVQNVEVSFVTEDKRSPVFLQDVAGIKFDRFKAPRVAGVPGFVLRDVTDFSAKDCPGLADTTRAKVEAESF